jgi:hypothetical protein
MGNKKLVKNRNQRGTQIEYSLPEKASWQSGFARPPTNTANRSFMCPLVKRWEEGERRQRGIQTWTESTARIAGSRRKGTTLSLVKPFSFFFVNRSAILIYFTLEISLYYIYLYFLLFWSSISFYYFFFQFKSIGFIFFSFR